MLNICFTFDYEIFFGKNYGTSEEILFKPTQKIIDLLNEEKVSATFFIDTCSVMQNMKLDKYEYVNKVEEQLRYMVKKGQDPQLHLHPHWLKSYLHNGEWAFNADYYRIHKFGFDELKHDSAYNLIKFGKDFLEKNICTIDKEYKCIAFRAGGFTIQPHQELVRVLYKNGIRIDSSIAPMLLSNGVNAYDFRKKLNNVNWWLSAKEPWNVEAKDKKIALFEIPVGTENKNVFFFLIKRILKPHSIKLDKGELKGTYIKADLNPKRRNRIVNIWNYITCYNALSLDAYQADYLYHQIKRFYKKNKCQWKDASIALIGHPKLVNDAYLDNLYRLICLLKKDETIRLTNIVQAYKKLGEKDDIYKKV